MYLLNLDPMQGDQTNTLLAKMLQRLQLNANTAVDTPSTNVVVTNLPLPVVFPTAQQVTVENVPHVVVDNVPTDIAVNNFPATQPVSGTVAVSNFPAGFNVNNKPSVYLEDPVTGELASIQDGHLSTLSVDFLFEIAHTGFSEERSALNWNLLGRRAGFNSTSVLQDLGEWLGTGGGGIDLLPELNGTEALEVVSSSAQDGVLGTGTRTVSLLYLNTSYQFASQVITLNGTTPVSLGALRARFIYWMEALTGGTSEVSAGNIDLRIAGAGAIHERITAGGNKSMTARFMVPDGYAAYTPQWNVGAIGNTQDFRLRATVSTSDRVLGTRYNFQDAQFVSAGESFSAKLPWLKFPPRCKIKVSTLAGATGATNRADTSIAITLVADEI